MRPEEKAVLDAAREWLEADAATDEAETVEDRLGARERLQRAVLRLRRTGAALQVQAQREVARELPPAKPEEMAGMTGEEVADYLETHDASVFGEGALREGSRPLVLEEEREPEPERDE